MQNKNALGFDVISDSLYRQLFPSFPRATLSSEAEQRVRSHFGQFGIDLSKVEMPATPDFDWKLPKLQGSTMREHFETMGRQFAEPYDKLARGLIAAGLPKRPRGNQISLVPGWTRYTWAGLTLLAEQVDCPVEDCFVYDCETLVVRGGMPIIATGASSEAWYCWLHPSLVDLSVPYEHKLYPLGYGKLGIGHNVSYDSQRSIEGHSMDPPPGQKLNVHFDTMSAHIVCNGFSGPQRWVTRAKGHVPGWAAQGCGNSLVACYNFHTWPEEPLGAGDKELRSIFVDHDLPYIRERLVELLDYALLDVQYTFELFAVLYKKVRQKRPSWVALAGMLQQSAYVLPVVDNWFEWIAKVEAELAKKEQEISDLGHKLTNDLIASFVELKVPMLEHNDMLEALSAQATVSQLSTMTSLSEASLSKWYQLMTCPWLGCSQLNWWIKPKARKGKGLPEWCRGGIGDMGKSSRLLHCLLKLQWLEPEADKPAPIFWGGTKGKWQFRAADGKLVTILSPVTEAPMSVLLTKDLAEQFKSGQISSAAEGEAAELHKTVMSMTYWISVRSRVASQTITEGEHSYAKDGSPIVHKVVAPDLTVHGTVSGRGVSPLWLTVADCSDHHRHKLGVELKSRVQPPKGKVFVQADFSAQELRIAAVMADKIAARASHDDKTQLGYVGSCVLSHGTIAGNKEAGTDPHTLTAKALGITRNIAKTVMYAMLYGAGVKTIAAAIFWEKRDYNEAARLAKAAIEFKRGKKANKYSPIWTGGSDSAAYTMLDLLGSANVPSTLLLGNQLTAPMCPVHCGGDFKTGRTNWGIQSTARDQGDCVSVAYSWLCKAHGINSRVIWLHHDEFLCYANEEDAEVCAWLLNVAHAWTWAFTHETCEIYDMSTVGVFFDDVLIQKCFRKSADLSLVTATNKDENMPNGRALLDKDMPAFNLKAVALAPHLYD